jgi:sodium-coupled neutral amino acid transporter 11
MILVAIVYVLVGIAGYLTFPGSVQGNILKNFSADDRLVSVGRMCLSITLLCGLPLIVHPCRTILDRHLFPGADQSYVRGLMLSLCILGTACAIAICIPDIVVIWSFLGSTMCSGIAFILPPSIYLKLRRVSYSHDWESKKAFSLLVTGVLICIVCTVESVLNTLH